MFFYKAVSKCYESAEPVYCQSQITTWIERRVKKTISECLRFASCIAKAMSAQPSRTNTDDVLKQVTAMFNKCVVMSVEDDCGPSFKHQNCWELLKGHSKSVCFLHAPTKNHWTVIYIKNSDESENKVIEFFESPIGRKKIKEQVRKAEPTLQRIKGTEQVWVAQKERNEFLFFILTVGNSDSVISEYIKIKCRQALACLKADESTSSQMKTTKSAQEPPTSSTLLSKPGCREASKPTCHPSAFSSFLPTSKIQ